MTRSPTRTIAVIGSGISGLGAAYLLSRKHRVEVFELEGRLGGHAHTQTVSRGGRTWTVDTGFIVFNHQTYPNFVKLLSQVGVAAQKSDMSFGVTCRRCGVEFSSRGLTGLFAKPSRTLTPSHIRTLVDIPRFNARARSFLEHRSDETISLGAFLEEGHYSEGFVRHFLLPMGAAIWSAAVTDLRAFPARSFLRFYDNHGWLTLDGAHQWYTIKGGSQAYVDAVSRHFAEGIHLATPVEAVRRTVAAAEVRVGGEWRMFDDVVLATHADQALRLLQDPSPEERQALGAFRYSSNHAVLHTDASVLPRARRAWASWNSETTDCRDERTPVTLTYHMNRLQAIAGPEQLCVSLNRPGIAPETILAEMDYTHPILDASAIDGQQAVRALNGRRHTYYCGAHLRYGFHEDGLRSALTVASAFGIAL